ncbi:MAG TPA: FG-GAP-like repeat-containing protein [Pyrinomonadaceae bacterium]
MLSLMNFGKRVRARSVRGLSLLLSLLLLCALAPFASRAQLHPSNPADANGKRTPVEFVPGEILVRYRSETAARMGEAQTSATLFKGGKEIPMSVERFDGSDLVRGLRLVRVPAADTLHAIAALNARADVLYAEPNYVRRKMVIPNDPRFREMWGLRNTGQTDGTGHSGTPGADIDAEPAWTITTGSRSVVVGVIDEGVDINHPDLAANIWRNAGETPFNGVDDDANGFVDDVNGWDFFHNDATVFDGSGAYPADDTDAHGTHVAGTIGAVGNNGVGVTGVNWQVSLMSLKILGREGEAGAPSSVRVTVRAYNYAKMMRDRWTSSGGTRGANLRVLNNSYGGAGRSQAELDAIRALGDSGILFVAAAGNDSSNNDWLPAYPASYIAPNLISVAATTSGDLGASFTNYGASTVSMAAPGDGILSTTPNGTYDFYSGTSMASPHVAGAAALVCANSPNINVRRLKAALMYSGDLLVLQDFYTLLVSGRRLSALKALRNVAENDTTPPSAVGNLQVGANGREHQLIWTAPGDNGNTGQAALYEIRYSDTELTTTDKFEQAMPFVAPLPAAAGGTQEATVNVPLRHSKGFIGIRAIDNVGNAGPITSVPVSIPIEIADPYLVAVGAAKPLSTGGTPLSLNGDDIYRSSYQLPFAFPFFGGHQNFITISTNGALYFGSPPERDTRPDDAWSTQERLNNYSMIAGLWDDLRTDRRAGDDVYVVKPDANRIIFRWQGVTYDTPLSPTTTRGENPVSFEVELRRDGSIETRYGAGNQKLFPVVGISSGAPDAYVVPSHTSDFALKSLTNAGAVTFTRRPPSPPTVLEVRLDWNSVVGGQSVTGTVVLNRTNPSAATYVTLSDNLTATTMPTSVTVPAGQLTQTFTIKTTAVSVAQSGTVSAKNGTTIKTAPLAVYPPTLTSILLGANSVVGGDTLTGSVMLNGVAPAVGTIVSLSDNLPNTTVPASVKVLAGQKSAPFTITTNIVSVAESGQVTASNNGASLNAPLAVRPIGVKTLSITPTPVVGGQSATGTVVLERKAPSDLIVSLVDNLTSTTLPASVTVPTGTDTATFTITTKVVTANQSGTLTAKVNGLPKSIAYLVKTASGPLCTTMSFAPPTFSHPVDKPTHLVAEDFNNDGYQDIAITDNYFNKRIALLNGDGSGGFSPAKYFTTGTSGAPTYLAAGDFNADGKRDLVVANGYSAEVLIFLNNGNGFNAFTRFPTKYPYARSVTVGDFNADGKQDLAVAHDNTDNISILLGMGAGRFAAPNGFKTGQNPYHIATGDFNADGKQDLAVANRSTTGISILRGDGAGAFALPLNVVVGYNTSRIVAGDFNADGKLDLVVAGMSTPDMTVLIGKGTGAFTATRYTLAYIPADTVLADINGDGKADLIFANLSNTTNAASISIMRGDGTGQFTTATKHNVVVEPSNIVLRDFNGDTKLDLAATIFNNYDPVMTVMNTCR